MTGLTNDIAEFIAGARLSAMPPQALERSKLVIADTFAAMVAGAGSDMAGPLLRYVAHAGNLAHGLPVLGTTLLLPAELSALLNGAFGAALDIDDVVAMMPGHPSAIVLAATLAARGAEVISGSALIEAHIVAIEVGAKLGAGLTRGHYDRGFHGTGTVGIFAGVAGLCSIRQLGVPVIRTALGIAASMSSGLRCNFGTLTKPLHTGWAARCAVAAVDLAVAGISAADDALEGEAGYFASYGVGASDVKITQAGLGHPWVVLDPGVALRRFACYNGIQRAMYAALELRSRLDSAVDRIESVSCLLPPGGLQGATHPRPRTGLEAKFSLPYVVAAGLVDGRYSLWTFSDEAVARPEVRDLMARVDARESTFCAAADPEAEGGRLPGADGVVEVKLTLASGRIERKRISVAPGHPARALAWSDVSEKFLDCALYGGLEEGRARAALGLLAQLETCDDIGRIVDCLRGVSGYARVQAAEAGVAGGLA